MKGMLEGIRVVEMGHVVAIPSTGALFADWGADVIKIEPLWGEMARGIRRFLGVPMDIEYPDGKINVIFEQLNRGKKSVAVNLRQPEGLEIAHKLIAGADVFMSNYEVSALKNLKMDYQSLSQINPRLVYALLTGYGTQGPDKDERGFDYSAAWARSGIQFLLGDTGSPPPPQRPGQMDNTAATHVAAAVLGALLYREKTGIGQDIECSLYHSALWCINLDIEANLLGRPMPKDDRTNAANPLWNTYHTKDDRWFQLVMLQPDAHWPDFCKAIGRPELEKDPRFHDLEARLEHRHELIPIIEAIVATKTLVEWEQIFRQHNCIYGRIQSPAEVITDPQALANAFFVDIDHPVAGPIKMVASPAKLGKTPARVTSASPEVGQHTEEILFELGYTWEEIEELSNKEVIR